MITETHIEWNRTPPEQDGWYLVLHTLIPETKNDYILRLAYYHKQDKCWSYLNNDVVPIDDDEILGWVQHTQHTAISSDVKHIDP